MGSSSDARRPLRRVCLSHRRPPGAKGGSLPGRPDRQCALARCASDPALPPTHSQRTEDTMQTHRRHRKFNRLVASLALALTYVLMAVPTTVAAGADVYGVGGGSIRIGDATKI